jgi:hypothetical protein
MNNIAQQFESVVCWAVVAAFATFWLMAVGLNDPPEFQSQYLKSAIAVAVIATPWVFAARMLWRACWTQNPAAAIATDAPALLLTMATAALPENRQEWGAAMTAELDQVQGRSSRWWFAAGCAWTALFPPRSSRMPLLIACGSTAAVAAIAGEAVGFTLPALRVFAVTFVALVGAIVTLAVARSRPLREFMPWQITTVAVIVSVASGIATTAYFLVMNPLAAEHLPPIAAIWLAILLAASLWFALLPPRELTTSRLARGIGFITAILFAAGFVWVARISVHTLAGPIIWTLLAPIPVFFVTSAIAAAVRRSFGAGVQAAIWAALLSTLFVFALFLPEAMHRYAIDGRTLGDGESGLPIGVMLKDAIWTLVQIPVFGLPFGVFGAALGRRLRGQSRQVPELPDHSPSEIAT